MEKSPSAHVFFHPTLVRVWVDTYLPIRHMMPVFVWAENNMGIEAFFPLIIWHRNWKNAFIRLLVPIGYSDYDYHNPIFSSPVDNIKDFWEQLFSYLKDNFSYDKIQIDGITDCAIESSSKWIQNEICPQLVLNMIKNEDQLMSFFTTSLRGDLRRQMRRLEEQGKMTFRIYNDWGDARSTFEDFMEEHRQKWPKAYKPPLFHQNLLKDVIRNGIVHFSSIDINNKPISWHLGFHYQNRFYYYMPVGRKDFSSFSPAKVHLYHLVKWAIYNGCEVFDHLRGDETYKSGWSNGYQYVYSYTKKSDSLVSQLKSLVLSLRH